MSRREKYSEAESGTISDTRGIERQKAVVRQSARKSKTERWKYMREKNVRHYSKRN